MRGRQVFMESLRLHGVDRIFGNPGTTESPLLDSLMDYPDIDYIVALHEGIAVGAASFYAQATGKTAVTNMHVAPGLGNAIGMIYGALKACSPMIVTAGQQDTRLRMRDPLLGHDLVTMCEPVVKWSVQVETADEMGAVMQRAFKIANDHPKGPVFVALPINVMEQETDIAARVAAPPTPPPHTDATCLSRLAELIRQCSEPGIVVSDDVARAGAVPELVELSDRIGAGVHTELLSCHVCFPMNHDHYRGRLGADHGAIGHALRHYDLVIMIGGPFFEEVWHAAPSPFAEGTRLVQIEETDARIGYNFPIDLGVTGEIRQTLSMLLDLLDETPAAETRRDALKARRDHDDENAANRTKALWDRSPMSPLRALSELKNALPENRIVVDESITAMGDVAQAFRFEAPHQWYAGRGGGIGQGIAGALGAAVAHPGTPIVAISGDGSAMYSIPSLWTAAHHGLDILFVILSNREYRVLKHNIDNYRQRFDALSNKPYPHMNLASPTLDFIDLASGMSVPAQQVTDPDKIGQAVETALATEGPYLIDLVVEGKERVDQPVA